MLQGQWKLFYQHRIEPFGGGTCMWRDGPGHSELTPPRKAADSTRTVGIRSLLPLLVIVLVLALIGWFTR